jgi:hypothetical protein
MGTGEAYARQARNTEAEWQAAKIRLRAEKKTGRLLKEMKPTGERASGKGRPKLVSQAVTLKDLGISRAQASRWQKLDDIPDDKFEAALENGKPTTASVLAA